MHTTLESHLEQLKRLGTDRVEHRNGSLYKHLQGTWQLLRQWEAPEATCLAGLYHSVYSTGGFEQQLIPLSDRARIVEMIGAQAERMVYLFCACDRPATHPRIGTSEPMLFRDRFSGEDYALQDNEWRALCEIMLANEMDLGYFDHKFYRKHQAHYRDLFTRFEPWLSAKAIEARRRFEHSLEEAR